MWAMPAIYLASMCTHTIRSILILIVCIMSLTGIWRRGVTSTTPPGFFYYRKWFALWASDKDYFQTIWQGHV